MTIIIHAIPPNDKLGGIIPTPRDLRLCIMRARYDEKIGSNSEADSVVTASIRDKDSLAPQKPEHRDE